MSISLQSSYTGSASGSSEPAHAEPLSSHVPYIPLEILHEIIKHSDIPTLKAFRLSCGHLKEKVEARLFRGARAQSGIPFKLSHAWFITHHPNLGLHVQQLIIAMPLHRRDFTRGRTGYAGKLGDQATWHSCFTLSGLGGQTIL